MKYCSLTFHDLYTVSVKNVYTENSTNYNVHFFMSIAKTARRERMGL